MSLVEITESIPALSRAGARVRTVVVNSFKFHHPAFVDDSVGCYARITGAGRIPMIVEIAVYTQKNLNNPEMIKVNQVKLTCVVPDENKKPRIISPGVDGKAI